MKNKILLRSDVQLQMCINNDVPVEIWVGGFFEGVTSILKFSENSITIANGYYLRSFCKICLNKSVKRK